MKKIIYTSIVFLFLFGIDSPATPPTSAKVEISVFVRKTKQAINVQMDANGTIGDLKKILQEKTGITIDRQLLVLSWNGNEASDTATVGRIATTHSPPQLNLIRRVPGIPQF